LNFLKSFFNKGHNCNWCNWYTKNNERSRFSCKYIITDTNHIYKEEINKELNRIFNIINSQVRIVVPIISKTKLFRKKLKYINYIYSKD